MLLHTRVSLLALLQEHAASTIIQVLGGENIQLERELFVQGKKKSAFSRINSLKLCTSDSSRVIIASADSKIRVADGDTIKKF